MTPRYDGWGPDSPWGCDDWIAYHRHLVTKLGEAEADRLWADAWLAGLSRAGGGRGTARGSGWVFDSVPVHCRTTHTGFHDYVAARPALYAAVYSGLGGSAAAPLGGAGRVLRGAGRVLEEGGASLEASAGGGLGFLALVAVAVLSRRR
jgi:hypothetical protein